MLVLLAPVAHAKVLALLRFHAIESIASPLAPVGQLLREGEF